ncbi:copper chaperone PCu(A)C [Bradyrhizobium sp.]|uniref:copper chaperone PCu(A)C n=1 Tax=Bradyrhizobium sp. TaxID=376 RepID=UPI004037BC9F
MRHMGHLVLALLLGLVSLDQASGQRAIVIDHPWARATPPGAKTGAVYLIVTNNGAITDRLLSAATPVADNVQFHGVSEVSGIVRMHEMLSVDVAPGGKITFSPGGMHIMLVGLKQPLKEGETLPLTLTFERAGQRDLIAPIAKVGAMQWDKRQKHDHVTN